MMHIGCSCTDHPQTTVVVKHATDVQAGDEIVSSTSDEVRGFDGSQEQVVRFARRNARTVARRISGDRYSAKFEMARGGTTSVIGRVMVRVTR